MCYLEPNFSFKNPGLVLMTLPSSRSQHLTWRTQDMGKCAMRGKLQSECYNYIKVLVPKNDQTLLACGTNAFNPVCRTYKISSLEQEGEELNGQARCPFDAKQPNVALFAEGNLYSATVADFLASDAVIYRSLGERSPVLRTVRYDSKWLREPHFLHALEYRDFVYFFFREISMEYTALGRVIFSPVGGVGKNDRGGSPRVLEKYWTSFLKARLNCSVPGDSFFYFDVLQAVTDVSRENGPACGFHCSFLFGLLPSIMGSAVCAFYMDEVERVFDGKFKEQKNADAAWTPIPEEKVPKPRPGCCAGIGRASAFKTSNDFPDEMLSFIKSFPLLDEAVPSIAEQPWFTKTASRYKLTHLAADPAAGPFRNYTVLFLGSEDGTVLKMLSRMSENATVETLLLEEVSVYHPSQCSIRKADRRVLGFTLDAANHALYVAFSSCVVRVPLSRCGISFFPPRSCLASRDPYCVWLHTGACVPWPLLPERTPPLQPCPLPLCSPSRLRSSPLPPTAPSAPSLVQRGEKPGVDQRGATPAPRQALLPSLLPPSSRAGGRRGVCRASSCSFPSPSAAGVRQEAEGRDGARTVHFTFLIGCVFVAFLLGAFLSGLLVSCYCSHAGQKGKHGGRDLESGLQRPLSLRSLARMNGLAENPAKDGLVEAASTKLYTTLLPSEKEPPSAAALAKAGAKEHPELSGLPTPESTPELPLKNMKAIRNQWERNQNFNNAKEAQGKPPLFHTPGAASHAYPLPSAVAVHGYDAPLVGYLDEKKIPNSERVLVRHSQCYLPKGVEVTTLEELLRHLHETHGPPRKAPGSAPAHLPPAAAAVSFANRVQPKIPDVESAPYYSSSTLPRDSLPRRLDVPPDPPPPQACLEKPGRPAAHRHSLCAAPKLANVAGGAGLARQHSLGPAGRPPPAALLTRMHSTGSSVPEEGRPAAFLARQHSYGEPAPLPSHGGIKRSVSLVKPSAPAQPLFMPSSPPARASGQFHY
uniref:Semaphorin 6C n=1 Tax=Varanus komodoensis TaxID=61221 RepID=A0A8D2J253_VARKO